MIRLTVPSVKGVDAKTLRGFIGQLAHPSEVVEGALTKFTGRNQLSVDATISALPSTRLALKVGPSGVSSSR